MEFEPDEWQATTDVPQPSWLHAGLSFLVIVVSLTLFALLIPLLFQIRLAIALFSLLFLLAVIMLGWAQYCATFLRHRKAAEVAIWLNGGLAAISGILLFMALPQILAMLVAEPQKVSRVLPIVTFFLLSMLSSLSNYFWWQKLKRYPVEEFKVQRRFRISLKEMLLAFTALTYVIGIMSLVHRNGVLNGPF